MCVCVCVWKKRNVLFWGNITSTLLCYLKTLFPSYRFACLNACSLVFSDEFNAPIDVVVKTFICLLVYASGSNSVCVKKGQEIIYKPCGKFCKLTWVNAATCDRIQKFYT